LLAINNGPLEKERTAQWTCNTERASCSQDTAVCPLFKFGIRLAAVSGSVNADVILLLLLLLVVVVISPWASLGRNQSPVRLPVWLWYAASWASS